jgi:thiol-disulfide isomerase/thioredoxin
MAVFTLPQDTGRLQAQLAKAGTDTPLVVCFCAAWCDTCRQYETDFANLAGQWPDHLFIWVDIEESPELLGDEDVENFPTILVQDARGNRFYGPLLPHIGHLDKLLKSVTGMPPVCGGPPPLRPLISAAA